MNRGQGSHHRRLLRLSVVGVVLAAVVLIAAPVPLRDARAAAQSFFPITPTRFLDTRDTATPILGGTTRNLQVAGVSGVPSDATAVALNVTATGGTAATFVTVWPAGGSQPASSNLNVLAAQTVPNMVVAGIGAGGQISVYSDQGAVHVIVDVTGYFKGGFTGIQPARLMDTRQGLGGSAIGAGESRALQVVGAAGVPATGVAAVALNVTAVYPTNPTFVTVWPAGVGQPESSNLNVTPGQIVPNMVVVGVGAAGQVSILNAVGSVNVIVDIMGWFSVGGGFNGITPARLLDTRLGSCGTTLQAGETRTLLVAGRGGVPSAGTGAVALNVTATNPTAGGYITVWPTGATRPLASNLNTSPGRTAPNMVTVGVGSGGQINIFNAVGTVDIIVDVMGWFDGATPAGSIIPCPVVPSPPPPVQTYSPGTYLVGSQMPSGRYIAKNATSGCYWERLRGLGGTLDDIIANDFQGFAGQAIVDVAAGDLAFRFDGDCGTFATYAPPTSPISIIFAGAHVIGSEIQPGTYTTTALSGCYWERLSGFGGTLSEIIANDFMSTGGTAYVTISPSDVGFRADADCGVWAKT